MTDMTKIEGGGRVTQWPLVRFAAYAAVAVATIVLATIATRLLVPPAPSPWHDLVLLKNLLLPIALFLIYAAVVRVMERRRADEVALSKGFMTLVVGIALGATIIGATLLALDRMGMVQITEGEGFEWLGRALLVTMVTAMSEELLFRVIFFGILEQVTGSLVAILISSAVFGLAHAANPGANAFALFALSVELGVMLSLAYMLTRNVWIAVGIHGGWNCMQSFVLGAENSGVRDPSSYFHTTLRGPEIMTGGAFGLEGSIVSLGLSVIVSACLLVLVARKRRWLSVRFRLGGPQRSMAPAKPAGGH